MAFEKNIRYLYVAMFFRKLIFAYVIERLFALERGMTVQLVVYTEIIYAITIIILGVISGILADKYGRKPLIVLGAIFTCFEFGVLIFAQGFWLFGLSAFVAGIGGSFKSGTWNALLYDSLLSCGKEGAFEKYLGRMQAIGFASALIAGLSGAFLAHWLGFTFNYWVSTGSGVISLLVTLRLSEPPKQVSENSPSPASIVEIVSSAYAFFKKHPNVLQMLIHVALIASIVNYVDEFWQVYLDDIYFPIMLFGVVSAVLTVTQMPGALLGAKSLKRFSHRPLIVAGSFLAAGGILWAAFVQHAVGIIGIAVVGFAVAFIEPIASGYLHHRAAPSSRATIESVEIMIARVFTIGIGLVFGYVSTRFSIFTGFWMLGVAAVLASLVFGVFRVRDS